MTPGVAGALGVGVDIVEIARVGALLERHPRAASRLFTDAELAHAAGRMRLTRLAGKFAAKEAVLKALGTGAGKGLWFTQVEVMPDELGAPLVTLRDAAAERARELGVARVLVSVSHETTHAVAMAVLVAGPQGR